MKRKLCLLIIPGIFGIAVLMAVIVRVMPAPQVLVQRDVPSSAAPGSAERALRLKELQDEHHGTIMAKVADAASHDPSYAKSISKVDEKFVRSLKGFSDAEREQLWRLIQSAQKTVQANEGAR